MSSRIVVGILLSIFLRPPAAEGQVEVRTLDGKRLVGALVSLEERGPLVLAPETGQRVTVDSAQVVSIRTAATRVSRGGAASPYLRFDLAGGDVLFGNIVDSDYDEVRIETPSLGPLTLPIDALTQAVVLANTKGVPRNLGADAPKDRDVLFVRPRNSVDQVVGEVSRFTRGGVYFEWNDDGETLFDYKKDNVVAVRLAANDELERPPATAVVHGDDGTRLTGTLTKRKGGSVILRLFTGVEVPLKLSSVCEIAFFSDEFTYLSDFDPARVVETPYLEGGLTYGLKRDVGLRGDPVTIGKTYFPKALAVHSRCDVSYDLGPEHRSFSSAFGIDGSKSDLSVRGAVAFSVILDGRVVFGPQVARAGEAPAWIDSLDVSGAKRLTLRADFADNFHFNGWAVWGGARLVRAR